MTATWKRHRPVWVEQIGEEEFTLQCDCGGLWHRTRLADCAIAHERHQRDPGQYPPDLTPSHNGAVWEEPGGGRQKWAMTLSPLTQWPGRWARIADRLTEQESRSRLYHLRSDAAGVDPRQWEFMAARTPEGVHEEPLNWAVYARYIAEEQAA